MVERYRRKLPTTLRSEGSADKNVQLSYLMLSGSDNETTLTLVITDDDNPLFVRRLHINSHHFDQIKIKQRLLVSFDEFPQYLINLLNSCSNKAVRNSLVVGSRSHVSFEEMCLCMIDSPKDICRLEIVMSNKNQTCVNLSLDLNRPSSIELQHFLCETLLAVRKELTEALRRVQLADESIQTREKEWKTNDNKRLSRIKSLERKISEHDLENQNYNEQISQLTESTDKLRHDNICLTEDIEHMKREMESFHNCRLQLEENIADLKSEIRQKNDDLDNLNKINQTLSYNYKSMEERCSQLEQRCKQAKKLYENQSNETQKGVEIIKLFKQSLCIKKEECKKQTQELSQCYRSIKERDCYIAERDAEVRQLKEQIVKCELEMQTLAAEKTKVVVDNEKLELSNNKLTSELNEKTRMVEMLKKQVMGKTCSERPLSTMSYIPVLGKVSLNGAGI